MKLTRWFPLLVFFALLNPHFASAYDIIKWNSRYPCLTSDGQGTVRINNPDSNYLYTVYVVKHDTPEDFLAFDANAALSGSMGGTPPYVMASTAGRDHLSDIILGERSSTLLGTLEDGIYTAFVVGGFYFSLPAYTTPTEDDVNQYGWMNSLRRNMHSNTSLRDSLHIISTTASMAHFLKLLLELVDNSNAVSAIDEMLLYDGISQGIGSLQESVVNVFTTEARLARLVFPGVQDKIDNFMGQDSGLGNLVLPLGTAWSTSKLTVYYLGLWTTTRTNLALSTIKFLVRGREFKVAKFAVADGDLVPAADYLKWKDRSDAVVDMDIQQTEVQSGVQVEAKASISLPSGATPASSTVIRWEYPGGSEDLPLGTPFRHTFTAAGTTVVYARVPSLGDVFGTGYVVVAASKPELTFDMDYQVSSTVAQRVFLGIARLNIAQSEIASITMDFGDGSGPMRLGGDGGGVIPSVMTWTHDYPSSTLVNSYTAACTLLAKDGRTASIHRTVVIDGTGWAPRPEGPRCFKTNPTNTRISIVQGNTQRFKMTATDPDQDMATVEWFLDEALQDKATLPSDEGITMSSRRSFTFNTPGEYRVLARVTDKTGAFDQVYWTADVAASTPPGFSAVSPDYPDSVQVRSGDIPVTTAMNADTTFNVTIADAEDDLKELRWQVNDETVYRVNLGTSPDARSWTTRFPTLGTYRVKAQVEDEFGKTAEVVWMVSTRQYGNPPSGAILSPFDSTPVPGVFRVGVPYDFEFNCFDADGDLAYAEVTIDGSNSWMPGDTDADDTLSGSADRVGTSDLVFRTAGEHVVGLRIQDSGGNEFTTTRTIRVEAADSLSSQAPAIVDIFPPSGRTIYYLQGSSEDDMEFVGVAHDVDGDLRDIVMAIDGQKVDSEGMSRQFSEEFSLAKSIQSLGLSTGLHTLTVYPADVAGNTGAPATYTLSVVSSQPNHAPEVTAMLPTGAVKVPSGTRVRFAVAIFDPDGDLDTDSDGKILWTAPGYSDEDTLSESRIDYRMYKTITLTQSGTVTAKVTDSRGNAKSVSWSVQVGAPTAAAPQILSPSWADGTHHSLPGRESNVDEIALAFSLYDADGDLNRVDLYRDGVLVKSVSITADFEKQGCRFIGDEYESLVKCSVDGEDANLHTWRMEVVDDAGHVTTHSATYRLLRDHPPVVPAVWSVRVLEDETLEAAMPYGDEDGDYLQLIVVTPPSHGELLLQPRGAISYDPDANYGGADSAVLGVQDWLGNVQQVTLNIAVEPVNDPPVLASAALYSSLLETDSVALGSGLSALVQDPDGAVDSLSLGVLTVSEQFTVLKPTDDPRSWVLYPKSGEAGQVGYVDLMFTDAEGAESARLRRLFQIVYADTDADGLSDLWENQNFGNLAESGGGDADVDGLTNAQEEAAGTDPTNKDSDQDGMSDGWEVSHSLNPLLNDAAGDRDQDGYTNLQEYRAGSDPDDASSIPRGGSLIPVLRLLLE